jgi:probable rRNA maturation factor
MPLVGSIDNCTILFRRMPASIAFSPREKRTLKAFACTLASRIGEGQPFTCLITRDQELQELNRTFLLHDYPTDVLSFPSCKADNSLGEMAISIDCADEQAANFGHARVDEVRILMLHGVLHLVGMDHEHDRGEMARAELRWRAELGLPGTLLTRAAQTSPTSQR